MNRSRRSFGLSLLRRSALGASLVAAALSAPASAQDQQADDAASNADAPIIVTATRREQALSDVPLAVSAIGGEALQNSGVTDLRALNQLAPSLIVSGATSESNFTARIRGIGTVGENPGLESSVALFIDGVYRSRTGAGLTELGEIERIEVMRGPQGTLFGRNSSAGLLNVVTKKPQVSFGGYAAATYGNYDYWRLEGGVTGPIAGDKVAGKLEGVYMKRNGFVKQMTPGEPDINDRDRWLLRGQLLFEPTSDVSFRLIGDYSKHNENCCAGVFLNPVRNLSRNPDGSVAVLPNTLAPLLQALGANYQFAPDGQNFVRQTATTPGFPYTADSTDWGVSGELNWNLGGAKLTSITAYRDYKFTQGQDGDFNALDLLHRADEDRRFRTFTQELRLQGEALDGRLDWLVGGYYANEKLDLEQNTRYGADYEKFANCLTIAALVPTALQTTNPFCINVPVVQATITTLSGLPANDPRRALIPGLSALIANPARPGFGSLAAALGQPNIVISNTGYANTFRQDSRNYAFFTHNVFDIVEDKLQLTLGARYTNERKHLRSTVNLSNTICPLLVNSPLQSFAGTVCSLNGTAIGFAGTEPGTTRSEDQWTGTAVLSFKPVKDVMLYASYAKGYKAGGYNLDVSALDRTCSATAGTATQNAACTALLALPANTQFNGRPEASDLQFAAEKVDAFEMGVKYNGRGIDINVAAFYSRFNNFQLNTFNGLTFEVTNVQGCKDDLAGADRDASAATGACSPSHLKPGVTSKGVEVEYILHPARDFTVNGGFTYLDTKYANNLVGTGGRPLSPVLFQLPGSRTFGAQYAITQAVSWTPRLSDSLTGLVYADMRYQSDVNTGSDLDREKIQDGYALFNARLGIYGEDRKWGIELWGQNLFNTRVQQIAADAPGQGSGTYNAVAAPASTGLSGTANQLYVAFPNEPRTYGVTLRSKF